MMQSSGAVEDFNPLDVLAAAASLPSAQLAKGSKDNGRVDNGDDDGLDCEAAEDDEDDSDLKVVDSDGVCTDTQKSDKHLSNGEHVSVPSPKSPCVIKVIDSNATGRKNGSEPRAIVSFRDATKVVVPTKQGNKMLTVLKINKQQVSDHSYAFVCQLEKIEKDNNNDAVTKLPSDFMNNKEHEAQLETQGSVNGDILMDQGGKLQAKLVDLQRKKPPKILIVSKTQDLEKLIGKKDGSPAQEQEGSNGNVSSMVLRTLLEEKKSAVSSGSASLEGEVNEQVIESESMEDISEQSVFETSITDSVSNGEIGGCSVSVSESVEGCTEDVITSLDMVPEGETSVVPQSTGEALATCVNVLDAAPSCGQSFVDDTPEQPIKSQEEVTEATAKIEDEFSNETVMDQCVAEKIVGDLSNDAETESVDSGVVSPSTGGMVMNMEPATKLDIESPFRDVDISKVDSSLPLPLSKPTPGEDTAAVQSSKCDENSSVLNMKRVPISKHQYIIEDDVPPVTKYANAERSACPKHDSDLLESSVSPKAHNISKSSLVRHDQPDEHTPSLADQALATFPQTNASPSNTEGVKYVLTAGRMSNLSPVVVHSPGVRKSPSIIPAALGLAGTPRKNIPISMKLTSGVVPVTIPGKGSFVVTQGKIPVTMPIVVSAQNSVMKGCFGDVNTKIDSMMTSDACITLSPSLIDNREADFALRKESSSDTDAESLGTGPIGSPEPIHSPASAPLSTVPSSSSLDNFELNDAIPASRFGKPIKSSLFCRSKSPLGDSTSSIVAKGSLPWKSRERKGSAPSSLGPPMKRSVTPTPSTSHRVVLNGMGSISGASLESMDSESSMDSCTLDSLSKSYDGPSSSAAEGITDVSARTCHAYVRPKKKASTQASSSVAALDLATTMPVLYTGSHLHPLVDHDYCKFTEFSAQVQSSILATTQCTARNEKKYPKKAKAARTKAVRDMQLLEKEKLDEKLIRRTSGPGRPKKILTKKVKSILELVGSDKGSPSASPDTVVDKDSVPIEAKKEKLPKRPKKAKPVIMKGKKDKNYVKITGSFQDEFIYYATKGSKRRPRKNLENGGDSQQLQPQKIQAVGGVNVFDWYKDLSNSDKSSRFGSTGSLQKPSTLMVSKAMNQVKCVTTPTHESEVADLVCELSEMGYGMNEQSQKPESSDESLDLMAEQVRTMLNSMGEAELKMLETDFTSTHTNSLENKDEQSESGTVGDTSMESLLGPIDHPSAPTLSQVSVNHGSNLCDLDDINDNDLLSTDLANVNMTMILGELTSRQTSSTSHTTTDSFTKISSDPQPSSDGTVYQRPNDFGSMGLDRTELFPDMSVPEPAAHDAHVPELTTVSMYWNDLPGLMISGKQHVRLVDIHKQVLPAKDTGILKKRCQMMGLEIITCSDLQRDFLIRYANAAKSKSTVVVSKQVAETLIAFYVEPKSRMPKNSSSDRLNSVDKTPKVKETSKTDCEKPAAAKSDMVDVVQDGALGLPIKLEPGSTEEDENGILPERTTSLPVVTETKVKRPKLDLVSRKRKLVASRPILNGAASLVEGSQPMAKRSERLKHKKVRYDKMHVGEMETSEDSAPTTPLKIADGHNLMLKNKTRVKLHKRVQKKIIDAKMQQRPKYPEDLEIQKLKNKGRRRKLSSKDKKKLRRLRDKVRRREKRRRLKDLHRQENPLGGNILKPFPSSRMLSKPRTEEHNSADVKAVVLVANDTLNSSTEDMDINVETQESPRGEPIIEVGADACSEEAEEQASKICPPLEVLHCDSVHRNGHRGGRSQGGLLFLDLYKAKDSICIRCSTCDELLSIKKYLKHLHHLNKRDELAEVTLPQKLVLTNSVPTLEEQNLWEEFEERTQGYVRECTPPDKPSNNHKSTVARALEMKTSPKLSEPIRTSPEKTSAKPLSPPPERESPKGTTIDTVEVSTPVVVSPPLHQPPRTAEILTPSMSNTRHSTRVRKRKQLHPIERYVFSSSETKGVHADACTRL